MISRQRNIINTAGFFRDLEDEANSFWLKDSDVKIWTTFSDENYNNDDNPYARIEMEYKTRLDVGEGGPKGTINLVECKDQFNEFLTEDMLEFVPGPIYCPDFEEHHRLMANYNFQRRAWLRISVHVCDNETRALVGKECASDAEIQDYFDTNLFVLYHQ